LSLSETGEEREVQDETQDRERSRPEFILCSLREIFLPMKLKTSTWENLLLEEKNL
jgi:hypothetical protein